MHVRIQELFPRVPPNHVALYLAAVKRQMSLGSWSSQLPSTGAYRVPNSTSTFLSLCPEAARGLRSCCHAHGFPQAEAPGLPRMGGGTSPLPWPASQGLGPGLRQREAALSGPSCTSAATTETARGASRLGPGSRGPWLSSSSALSCSGGRGPRGGQAPTHCGLGSTQPAQPPHGGAASPRTAQPALDEFHISGDATKRNVPRGASWTVSLRGLKALSRAAPTEGHR